MFRFRVFFTIIFAVLVQATLSINQQYEACVPKHCGDGLNITYPFWIQEQHESYCGESLFRVTCIDDKPRIRISDEDYIVRDISRGSHSVLVVDEDVFYGTCPTPLHNISLVGAPFEFSPNYMDLYFFYNCTSLPSEYSTYPILCGNSTRTDLHSLAVFLHELGLQYVNASSLNCEFMVKTPVEIRNGMTSESMMKEGYINVLRDGFVLNWPVANNCTRCEKSGGHCGFQHSKFVCFCRDGVHGRICSKGASVGLKVAIGVSAGVGCIILTCVIFFLYQRRKKKLFSKSSNLITRDISDRSLKPDVENGSIYFQTPIFTYKELDEATNHFDTNKEVGDGGFGTVYHGKLRDGRVVAIKRLFEHNYKRVAQFMNEIEILSRIRHQNLVSLYGCTSQYSRELLLVYEYVPNGTVGDHVHGERAKAGLLTWPIRMSIAIESADALAYLHASDIIHRDVKSNNILLDNNFHVKVADFGLSRLFPNDVTHVSTAPQGTPGYVDPEYYQCYQLNDKSDVYSFGVVLIELISSKPAVDIGRHRHEVNLASLAINKIHSRALHELVDPSLGFDTDYNIRNMITSVAELAFRCLQQEKEMRPCMVEVVEVLRGIQSEDYRKKTDEMDSSADKSLLKNMEPLSPVSVTQKWVSSSTTPNSSAGGMM